MLMRSDAYAAFKVGVFGIILVGLSSLLFGLLSRLVALDPIVYFAAMAGVMVPMVMVMAGALALWASQNPGLLVERPGGGAGGIPVLPSLIAGLIVIAGAAFLFLLALALPLEGVFPTGRLSIYAENLDAYGYLEIAVLLAAYVALAVIGGMLYGIVVPEEKHFVYK
jgi:hypothetical protein